MRPTAPVCVSADVTLGNGLGAICDTAALASPFRKAMWLHEIRWVTSYFNASNITMPVMGASIRCRLKLGGRIALTGVGATPGFVPLWLFAPVVQDPTYIEGQGDSFFGVGQNNRSDNYRWKLPKPLYIPAGSQLTCEFQRDQDLEPNAVQVTTTYVGRYADEKEPIPATVDAPWVTAFVPQTFSPPGAFITTTEDDLVNPFMVDLNVQRFVNRFEILFDAGGFNVRAEFVPNNDPNRQGVLNSNLVMMKDSAGYTVVRDFTLSADVFDWLRRSWTFQRVLKPKERYQVQFFNVQPASFGTLARPLISLVGWRKEINK